MFFEVINYYELKSSDLVEFQSKLNTVDEKLYLLGLIKKAIDDGPCKVKLVSKRPYTKKIK